jgi:hypothetical protein
MRRLLARVIVLIMALSALGVGVRAYADPVPIPDPYAFTSADVGFVDGGGGSYEGQASRIAAMDAYVGDKKPIVRVDLVWNLVQPTRDVAPNWTDLDRVIDAAYEQGVRVLLILDYATPWANGGRDVHYFPTDDAAWAGIVRQAVAHFGPKVQAYEVWNEPNSAIFGNYGDNSVDVRAGRYWQLTKIAYQEVKAGCPQCVVVAGGSIGGDTYKDANGVLHADNEASDWLEWAYQHGMGGYMDAVAYHPYPDVDGGTLPSFAKEPCNQWRQWMYFGPDDPQCGGLAALRAEMVLRGYAGKQIWGTEFGFSTDGASVPSTPEHVRDALEEGIRMWRSRPGTGPLFIYTFQDAPPTVDACVKNPHAMACHFGLRDSNGNPKEPMYSDVRAALIGDNWLPTLAPGRSLFRGAALRSANGQFTLKMQADGNLVLYDNRGGAPAPIWVRGDLRAYRLTNQHDGNLVLYDYLNQPLWASSTRGTDGSTLRLQDDGALVVGPGASENWSVAPGATAYRHVAGPQAETGTNPYEGSAYTSVSATQALGSIYQDINRTISPGDTFCANAHVVTEGEATNGGGTFALFLTGGTVETSNKSLGDLPNGNHWTPVSTCVTATSAHSAVRVQYYPAVGGPAIGIDAVDVHQSIAKNGGFNNGFNNWTVVPGSQYATYGPGTTGNNPYEGSGFAATNTTVSEGGIYQDINLTVNAGDTFCANAQVATQGTARGAGGRFAIWLAGGTQEQSYTDFANVPGGDNWTPISTCVTATTTHNRVRVQFYLYPNAPTLVVDAVDVHQSIAENGGFNNGFNNWTGAPDSNWSTYGPNVTGNNPYEGTGFAATNTTVAASGGIYQDVNLTVKAGDTFCGSAQVATQGTTKGASGSFALWLIGGSQENSVTTYANLPGGNDWTPISACITAATAYSKLRVQFYPDPNTGTVVIDDVDVRQSLAVNDG